MRRRSCLLLIGLAVAACDAPSADPVDARPAPDVTPPDADSLPPVQRLPAGAPCTDDQCARGACVNGVCSTLCARDADCEAATPVCVARGGGGRCSASCASAVDCAPGLICAVLDVGRGFCVAPGPGVAGAECAGREDCASWFCAGGRCRAACDDAPCGADETCLALHTQAVCAPAGEGAAEDPCAVDADCASSICRGGRCSAVCPDGQCADDRVCVRYASANLCERRCATSADCGAEARCLVVGRQRLCVTAGPGAPGDACAGHAECATGRCDLGRCAAPCDATSCPAGQACVTDITGAACRPAGPAAPGARCDRGDLCASGVCGGGVCTSDCAAGACPEGQRCVAFSDGRFCFPTCGDDADCAGPAFCDADFAEGPICYWRGAAAVGEACAGDRACASGRCGAGRCLEACTAECPADLRCVSVGRGRFCAAPPLPEGAACDAVGGCADGLACTAGRCLPPCAAGCPADSVCRGEACHPVCAADADCRPGRRCDVLGGGACIDPGDGGPGAACASSAACAAGLCLDGQCRADCRAGCGPDETCLEISDGAWCVPAGEGQVGAVCDVSADCAAGLCLGRRCAGACPDDGCPEGTVCDAPSGRCRGACGPDRPCVEGEVCAPSIGAAEGICVAAVASVGAPCGDAEPCGRDAVGCIAGPDGLRCRAPCRVGGTDCAADESCAPTPAGGGACVPRGPGPDLAPCTDGGECGSGWCVAYLDGRCGRPCLADADCGADQCVDLARDPAAPLRVCAPRCATDDDCEAPLRCRRDLDGEGACY